MAFEQNDQLFGHKTYSQHGDDMMVANLFHLIGIRNPSYLDLGAHHPTHISNTALLYERGSRGVNVEANPSLFKYFQEMRPEDTNVAFGVGLEEGTAALYIRDEFSGLNSLVKSHLEKTEKITGQVTVPVKTVNQIVKDYCDGFWPDFLNCDIEGLDLEVLKSADFSKNKPKVICVEANKREFMTCENIKMHLANCGYICYARCGENLIFIDRRYEFQVS